MKIRSITCFYHPTASAPGTIRRLGRLAQAATDRFTQAGYEVQTTRLSSTPFPQLLPQDQAGNIVHFARRLESAAAEEGFAYLSLGPALPALPASYEIVPEILAETRNVFLSGVMATGQGVSLPAAQACGRIIAKAAAITPDGFANLRFAALACVQPFGPFFPASYSAGAESGFALAVECADAAVDALARPVAHSAATGVAEGRARLLETLNTAGKDLARISAGLAEEHGVRFHGIDFSLAPFPADCCSLGGAIERLGAPQVGLSGSLAAAAILADTLDQGSWPRAGFNGLMMPVLEDSVLATRAGETLTVKDLLLYSAVCGAGLDTVPLPGSATPAQLTALLVDVAALAVRLGKPLTARLMPVPGKKAGERTGFDFGFFKNGKILRLPAAPLEGPLAGSELVPLSPRKG